MRSSRDVGIVCSTVEVGQGRVRCCRKQRRFKLVQHPTRHVVKRKRETERSGEHLPCLCLLFPLLFLLSAALSPGTCHVCLLVVPVPFLSACPACLGKGKGHAQQGGEKCWWEGTASMPVVKQGTWLRPQRGVPVHPASSHPVPSSLPVCELLLARKTSQQRSMEQTRSYVRRQIEDLLRDRPATIEIYIRSCSLTVSFA